MCAPNRELFLVHLLTSFSSSHSPFDLKRCTHPQSRCIVPEASFMPAATVPGIFLSQPIESNIQRCNFNTKNCPLFYPRKNISPKWNTMKSFASLPCLHLIYIINCNHCKKSYFDNLSWFTSEYNDKIEKNLQKLAGKNWRWLACWMLNTLQFSKLPLLKKSRLCKRQKGTSCVIHGLKLAFLGTSLSWDHRYVLIAGAGLSGLGVDSSHFAIFNGFLPLPVCKTQDWLMKQSITGLDLPLSMLQKNIISNENRHTIYFIQLKSSLSTIW